MIPSAFNTNNNMYVLVCITTGNNSAMHILCTVFSSGFKYITEYMHMLADTCLAILSSLSIVVLLYNAVTTYLHTVICKLFSLK